MEPQLNVRAYGVLQTAQYWDSYTQQFSC